MEKMENIFDSRPEMAWCPGCGNFAIRNIMLQVLQESGLQRQEIVFVSGIGQAAKAPQYYNASYFNGLHGRALPAATGINAANPRLKIIVESGDGDMYGEGGNHFIHALRRNPDITIIVHDNMVYGLTKGQASPTSSRGMVTPIQVSGVTSEPLNPLALAVSLDASFVARVAANKPEQMKQIISQAIRHEGLALIDVFQSCVTFNKVNTFKWFAENTVLIDDSHNPRDRQAAFAMALRSDPWPLGIVYLNETKTTFSSNQICFKQSDSPLRERRIGEKQLRGLVDRYR